MVEEFRALWAWSGRLTEVWIEQGERLIAKMNIHNHDRKIPPVILLPEGEVIRLPEKGQVTVTVRTAVNLRLPEAIPDPFLQDPVGDFLHFQYPTGLDPFLAHLTLGVRQEFLGVRAVPERQVDRDMALAIKRLFRLPALWYQTLSDATLTALEGVPPQSWDWAAETEWERPRLERFLLRLLTGQVPPVLVCPADLGRQPAAAALVRHLLDLLALGGEP